ncbi:MAG TPA: biopolymer transporter Tol [Opitutaceae bacterium]|jgi:TolB protein
MHSFFKSLLALAALSIALPSFGYEITAIDARSHTGTIPVRVSANSPQLESLAQQAFGSHGRYEVTNSPTARYNIRFTYLGGNSVRVDVTHGVTNDSVLSQSVAGTSAYNALLKAADLAVERTNGKGLRGFFASRITFLAGANAHREVYVSDLFCVEAKRLTSDRRDALFPRWSPDGQRIVYTSYLHGTPDIYLINLGSYTRSTFASYKGLDMSARFSPDGSRVAMVLSGTGSPEIWVSDGSGYNPHRLTHSETAKSSPCWSPDGRQILFAEEPGPHLFLMSAYGGSPRLVCQGLSSYNAEPDWIRSNGHDLVAFTTRAGGFQIAVADDFNTPKVVSSAPFDGIEPTWLPDGRHLVYTARTPSSSQICILDTETGKSTPIRGAARLGPTMQASVLR